MKTLLILSLCFTVVASRYSPTWESVDSRPIPQWYNDAKIGIFMHWGVFSVPSFGTEWFWNRWKSGDPSFVNFVKNNYRPNWTYADFARDFTTEFFNPDDWAELFKASGAKYVVLTSKHHEGFTNWPSNVSFNWNSKAVGPNKDLVGMLADSIRAKTDIHFGSKALPELYELVMNYKPEVIWSDGDWEASSAYWNSTEFLAWLYNDSPVKDTVAVNDRWGNDATCKHGGYYTCSDRFNPGTIQKHKFENAMTIDRSSWGYRREAKLEDYLTIETLLETLAQTVSCNGNLLMNIGPTKDGRIIPIFEERLRQMGKWLGVNGDAIYESRPWKRANDTMTKRVYYTMKPDAVYATFFNWPMNGQLMLKSVTPMPNTKVSLLGYSGNLMFKNLDNQGISVSIPALNPSQIPTPWAWLSRLSSYMKEMLHTFRAVVLDKLNSVQSFLIDNLSQVTGRDIQSLIDDNGNAFKVILGSSVCIVIAIYISRRKRKISKEIPGPAGWPIVGNYFDNRDAEFHNRIDQWAKQFQGIFQVNLLSKKHIVVTSLKGLQECLLEKSTDYAGRSETFRLSLSYDLPNDLIFTSFSPEWNARKKLAMKSMKMYGEGLEDLERVTDQVLDDFFKNIDEKQGQPWVINEDIINCFVNIIFTLALGKRLPWNDPAIGFLKKNFDAATPSQISPEGIILDIFPFLWKMNFPSKICSDLQKGLDANKWFKNEIDEQLKTFEANKPRGYLDLFYQEYLNEQKLDSKTKISYPQLVMMTIQTLIAGYATTATAVTCFIQLMLRYPEIQEKIYHEIIDNVGNDRRPNINDKNNHHYLMATIYELLRFTSHVPFSVHKSIKNTTLLGYEIPKNTTLITFFWGLHHDEKIFPEPYKFKPERYLEENGEFVAPGHPCRKALFAFGAGRRVCLGETLAKNRLFLVIGALVQNYKFLPGNGKDIGEDVDPRDYKFGIVLNPGDLNVRMIRRNGKT
ncbi:DgyrCDS12954 [Dimorphilus gyrociliatus]|uniref:alpha-L-fucosidase n=1 Tax=Dimorphilus gyrociliatus TaxID=2664684 RepID=A0A7I8W997_9ANNE|nr:DgyrCDS12954 [Dimorphilus gyrociliatus]